MSTRLGYAPGKAAPAHWESIAKGVASGDFDGDGDIDLVYITKGNTNATYPEFNYGQDWVALNNGSGFFDTMIALGGATTASSDLAVGDMDADGDLDIVVAYNEPPLCRIFVNDGHAAFTETTPLDIGNIYSTGTGLAIGKLNGDDALDVVLTCLNLGTVAYISDGSGGYGEAVQISSVNVFGYGHGVAIGDLNGDGKNDVAIAKDNGYVYFGDGAGAFTPTPIGVMEWGGWRAVGIGNFIGDAGNELVMGGTNNAAAFRIRRWDSATTSFVDVDYDGNPATNHAGESRGQCRYLCHGDLDADGDLDIVVGCVGTGYGSNPGAYYLNRLNETTHDFLAVAYDTSPRYVESAVIANVSVGFQDGGPEIILGRSVNDMLGDQSEILFNDTRTSGTSLSTVTTTTDNESLSAAATSPAALWTLQVSDTSSDGLRTTIDQLTYRADIVPTAQMSTFPAVTWEYGNDGQSRLAITVDQPSQFPLTTSDFVAIFGSQYSNGKHGVYSWEPATGLLITTTRYSASSGFYSDSGSVALLPPGGDFLTVDDFDWSLSYNVGTQTLTRSGFVNAVDSSIQFMCSSFSSGTTKANITLNASIKSGVSMPDWLDGVRIYLSTTMHASGSTLELSSDTVKLKTKPVEINVAGSALRIVSQPSEVSQGADFPLAVEYVDANGNRDWEGGVGRTVRAYLNAQVLGTVTFNAQGLGSATVALNLAPPASATLRIADDQGVQVHLTPITVLEAGVPVVSSMSGRDFLAAGGEAVVIEGIGFEGATLKFVNPSGQDVTIPSQSVISDVRIEFQTPNVGTVSGSAAYTLVITGTAGEARENCTFAPFVITGISPNIGTYNTGGINVVDITVTGRGFLAAGIYSVHLGVNDAPPSYNISGMTDTSFIFRKPRASATSHVLGTYTDLRVNANAGSVVLPKAFGWIRPSSGPISITRVKGPSGDRFCPLHPADGQIITLYGTGLWAPGSHSPSFYLADNTGGATASILNGTGGSMTLDAPTFPSPQGLRWPSNLWIRTGESTQSGATAKLAPVILSLSPNTAAIQGDIVTLKCIGLSGGIPKVYFGTPSDNTEATILGYDYIDTARGLCNIRLVPPIAAAGSVQVVLTASDTTFISLPNAFTFEDRSSTVSLSGPIAKSLSQTDGSVSGGESITLHGYNLLKVQSVTFGGVAAEITKRRPTSLTLKTPAQASSGVVDVVATDNAARFSTLAAAFTYRKGPYLYPLYDPATPQNSSNGPFEGSSLATVRITLNGLNLADVNSILIGSASATILNPTDPADPNAHTAYQVVADVVNLAPGLYDITISNGVDPAYVLEDAYTSLDGAMPIITGIDQTRGRVTGNGLITIRGRFFGSSMQDVTVTIGGVAVASIVTVGDTAVQVYTAPMPAGVKDIVLRRGTNEARLVGAFTVYPENTPILFSSDTNRVMTTGGTLLTLQGDYLSSVTSVFFGATPAASFEKVGDLQLRVTSPALSAGNYTLTVSDGTHTAAVLAGGVKCIDPTVPAPTNVSPKSASNRGGVHVVINGTSLGNVNSVKIGGEAVEILSQNLELEATSIEVRIPVLTVGADKDITLSDGTHTVQLSDAFTVYDKAGAQPSVTYASPTSVSMHGGDVVTLSGTDCDTITAVLIDNRSAEIIEYDYNWIRVSVPDGEGKQSSVSITVKNGAFEVGRDDLLSYIDARVNIWDDPRALLVTDGNKPILFSTNVTAADQTGGSSMTIYGVNLSNILSVNFGNAPATQYRLGSIEPNVEELIIEDVPESAVSGKVKIVVTTGEGASNPLDFTYNYVGPELRSVTPSHGIMAGGDVVRIAGLRFGDLAHTSVKFGTDASFGGYGYVNATVTSVTPEEIVVVVPPFTAAAVVEVIVSISGTINGTVSVKGSYQYFANDALVLVSVAPNVGDELGGEQVTFHGHNLDRVTKATIFAWGKGEQEVPIDPATRTATSFVVTTFNHRTLAGAGPRAEDVSVYAGSEKRTLTKGFTFAPGTTPRIIDESLSGSVSGYILANNGMWYTSQCYVGGAQLDRVLSVTVGGAAVTTFGERKPNSLSFATPPSLNGPGTVDAVFTFNDLSTITIPFIYTPFNFSVSPPAPAQGNVFGSYEVFVTGANLYAVDKVYLENATVSVETSIVDDSIRRRSNAGMYVRVPVWTEAPGPVDLRFVLNVKSGLDDVVLTNAFEFTDVNLAVDDLTPATGRLAGGQNVAIHGQNLNVVESIYFETIGWSGLAEVALLQGSPSRSIDTIIIITPPGPIGGGPVDLRLVPIAGAGADYVMPNAFVYETPLTPFSITSWGPQVAQAGKAKPVVFQGASLDLVERVLFDDIAATIDASSTATKLVVTPPVFDEVGRRVRIALEGGMARLNLLATYEIIAATVDPVPELLGVNPNHGALRGGDGVLLSGRNLSSVTLITFGGVAASIKNKTNSQIVVLSPDMSSRGPGAVDVVISDGTNSDTLIAAFTYEGRNNSGGGGGGDVAADPVLPIGLLGCALAGQSGGGGVLLLFGLLVLCALVRRRRAAE